MNARIDIAVATLLLGTVMAAAGWIVTHFVDNVVSVPTIEYDIEYNTDIDDCQKSSITVTIRNLSRTVKFSDLKFILRLPVGGNGKFKCADMQPIEPFYRPREEVKTNDAAISYPATRMHPETALKLVAWYSGVVKPTFHIAGDGTAVRPVVRGFLTWIIRNEIIVFLALFLVWSIVVPVVLVIWNRALRRYDGTP